ncbi:hypothetical protein [Chitinibacter sp. ZOR0017]|uniref:hypothetical protein n=1 Tax=Chitinibacter sp. ZOR0017 TaxID=1339254 RepID=UPI0006487FAF|nr:hypothetical protein [Chitinibacter sp. ZOR0017]
MSDEVVENQVITQPVITENLFTGYSIGTFQENFQLCEADFLRLKNEGTPLTSWSLNLFFATIGYFLSILPKWISEIAGKPERVSQSEWVVLAIGAFFSLALFIIGKLLPNEKKILLNQISQHFKSAPKCRQFIREQK